MAALPFVPFMAGAAVGAVASSLLGGGGGKGGSQSAPTMPTQPAGTQMPSLLASSNSATGASATQAGAGVEETNPADAKKASLQAQQRRRGRRSTILTGRPSDEESEYLGGA